MQSSSSTHLVLIPSYNPGEKVLETVRAALANWLPVWVIVDGSTDGSVDLLQALAMQNANLRVLVLPHNQGKGAAVLHGMRAAKMDGFTHVLTMDSDGQHPAQYIKQLMQYSQQQPAAMILGRPVFDATAPRLRVNGRKVSNGWANLETLWSGIGDSLFGFRVYPIVPLIQIMQAQRWMRRFDFDPEAVVRLSWAGVRPINVDTPVRYIAAEDGGVSHFNYWRDNKLLTWMHLRLMLGFAVRLPNLLFKKLGSKLPP